MKRLALLGCFWLIACNSSPRADPPPAEPPAGTPSNPLLSAGASVHAPATGQPTTVTLITGDRVRVTPLPNGKHAFTVEPGTGREHIAFYQSQSTRGSTEKITVLPEDAAPLVAAGRLDPQLFDVVALMQQSAGDAHGSSLRYIVTHTPGIRALAMPSVRAAKPLASIHGEAVAVDAKDVGRFWGGLTAHAPPMQSATLAGGVAKVWLDAIVQPVLAESVPQIGGPVAWQRGLTGKGVTVAILDTGIRTEHPDFKDRIAEARDFTGTDPAAGDDKGHGTHCAGAIAGTGAASEGRYKGVAPDAKLLVGKVCTIAGCSTSGILEGMEWAAARAPLVSISLGSDNPSDGTDPMSQAVDALTAQYGTLFVVAAGNAGESQSIGSPGAADAALTVGSMTKQGTMSYFSSRGPRVRDYAVKPDIVATGSDIVSARAKGTPNGDFDPVDDGYARLSGTSMATPQVAGAAALLLQQHPDWKAPELKAALMGSAARVTDAKVADQGAGRVDLARATGQTIRARTTSLGFGMVRYPHSQPTTKTVTYQNDGDTAVTLALAPSITGADGSTGPANLITVSPRQITVPAHGRADANITLNSTNDVAGLYSGWLSAATAPGDPRDEQALVIPITVFEEPLAYDLTLRLTDRSGHLPQSYEVTMVDVAVNEAQHRISHLFDSEGKAVVRVRPGTYDIHAFIGEIDPDGSPRPHTLISQPGIAVTQGDVEVPLDGRRAKPVTIKVDRRASFTAARMVVTSNDGLDVLGIVARDGTRIFATPTKTVRDHGYAFIYSPALTSPAGSSGRNPYIYQLGFVERGRIPNQLGYRVRDRELARVETDYFAQGTAMNVQRHEQFIVGDYLGVFFDPRDQALPGRTTEYYSPGHWSHWATWNDGRVDAEYTVGLTEWKAGYHHQDWNRAPIGPAFNAGVVRSETCRFERGRIAPCLVAGIGMASPSENGHFSQLSPYNKVTTGTTTLSRDGVILGTSPKPGSGKFEVAPGAGTYTLRSQAARTVPWSALGTRIDAAWTFRTEPPAGSDLLSVPPLMIVRADLPVDRNSAIRAGRLAFMTLNVEGQPGQPNPKVDTLALDVSYDDGQSWRTTKVHVAGRRGYAILQPPRREGFGSLRIHARDTDGNEVTHTVVRAFKIATRTLDETSSDADSGTNADAEASDDRDEQ
ncbi:S8 family serine peptidase [Pendulispora albinea]|uniref:S8 family serine peptidase n=1 Tax=Pendulispora albinea TaxID=2741071 RepID=A0ABZ2LP10_9BACT